MEEVINTYPASFFYVEAQRIFEEIYPQYRERSREVLRRIETERNFSQFDAFNKRLKISCGLELSFSDQLNIHREDTRACYVLMYKISDLWYAFEHLLAIAPPTIPCESKSKVAPFSRETVEVVGLVPVSELFGELSGQHVTAESKWRKELYPVLSYFINNTERGTKKALQRSLKAVKEKNPWGIEDLLALAYGIRNLYVHKGVMAALGTQDYALKRRLYQVILDCLKLAAFQLGSAYAECALAHSTPSLSDSAAS